MNHSPSWLGGIDPMINALNGSARMRSKATAIGDCDPDEADGHPDARLRLLLPDGRGQRSTLYALADIFYLVAAFRPDRSPELVMLLNDMAWMIFIAPVGAFVAQNVFLGLAIYFDDGPHPVFGRWVGHYAIATALAMAPAAGAAVFTTGPLAWNGAVSFWLRNGAFALFVVVMFVVLRNVLHRQAVEEGVAR